MKFEPKDPPRTYTAGYGKTLEFYDCGSMMLQPNEQITFFTDDGGEYDVMRKDWGFYATPSLNGRLSEFNLRAVMVKNRMGRYYILLVEGGYVDKFNEYLNVEGLKLVTWMDTDDTLAKIEASTGQ